MIKVSGCDIAEIGARMRAARGALGLSQEGLANAVGGSKRGIQNNEALKSVPGGEILCGLIALGINANWLLSGAGSMLLADTQAQTISLREAALIDTARFGAAQSDTSAPPASALDPARLRLAIETVEEGLAATQRTMTPEKKAELVTAVYDLFADDTSAQAKGKVLRLVKLAA